MLHRPGQLCGHSNFCSLKFQVYFNERHLLVFRWTAVVNQYNFSGVNQVVMLSGSCCSKWLENLFISSIHID